MLTGRIRVRGAESRGGSGIPPAAPKRSQIVDFLIPSFLDFHRQLQSLVVRRWSLAPSLCSGQAKNGRRPSVPSLRSGQAKNGRRPSVPSLRSGQAKNGPRSSALGPLLDTAGRRASLPRSPARRNRGRSAPDLPGLPNPALRRKAASCRATFSRPFRGSGLGDPKPG